MFIGLLLGVKVLERCIFFGYIMLGLLFLLKCEGVWYIVCGVLFLGCGFVIVIWFIVGVVGCIMIEWLVDYINRWLNKLFWSEYEIEDFYI